MSVRVVPLGDSTSCGEGVGLSVEPSLTWPARLARAVPGGELRPLAAPGARVRDVLERQLARAVEAEPHLATLLIGLNDVGRGVFCAPQVGEDLLTTVRALRRTGATVLLGRLHDPTRHLPLPPRLRREARARVATVNAAVDRAAAAADVHVLDLAAVAGLEQRRAWAVDRLHPAPVAHGLMAAQAARVLAAAGLAVGPVTADPLPTRAPGPAREAWWVARHGVPWLAGHLREVVEPAVAPVR